MEVPVRTVEVFQLEILDWREGEYPELEIAIACGSGTYIRAIARDLGAILETGGTLAALIRTESSGFHLADSSTLGDLEAQLQNGIFQPIALDTALQHLPSMTLPATSARKWCQGQRIPVTPEISGIVRVYNEETRFLGIGQVNGEDLVPSKVLDE